MPGSDVPGTFALSDFQAGCQGKGGAWILRRAVQKTIAWSGGTTTEIAIYPADSAYSRRDFLWRASSATVEADESEFTSLPGFWRLIMVLEGELELEHVGHHHTWLLPFEQDAFDGAWITRSRGRARDFNLMLAEGCTGTLHAVGVEPESHVALCAQIHQLCKSGMRGALIVYSVDGMVSAGTGADETWKIATGDAALLMHGPEPVVESAVLWNKSHNLTHVVVASICYPEVR